MTAETVIETDEVPNVINVHLSRLIPNVDGNTLRRSCGQRLHWPDTHRMFGILRNVGGKIRHKYVTLRQPMM